MEEVCTRESRAVTEGLAGAGLVCLAPAVTGGSEAESGMEENRQQVGKLGGEPREPDGGALVEGTLIWGSGQHSVKLRPS